MKTKIILLMPVAFMFTALMLNGQSSVHPQGDIKIPFGKRLPPPPNFYAQKNISHGFSYPKFDSATKQMKWFYPNSNQAQNYQQHRSGTISNDNLNSATSNIHLVKDINKLAESNPSNYSSFTYYNPPSFAVLNNVTYFAADDGVHGTELWRSDGTAAGTYLVKDINPGSKSAGIAEITAVNNKIYFSAFTDAEGQEPWISDGTEAGTQLLYDVDIDYPGASSNPTEFVNVNGTVFFIANGAAYESAIWKTDGTTAGTVLVKDLWYSDNVQEIFMATAANGLLFFAPAYSPYYGRELWRSDGTYDGTYMVKDINPYGDSDPLQLTEFNGKLYFSADDGSGRKLWITDGTYEGTIYAPNNNNVTLQGDYYVYYFNQPFTVVKKTMYFWAYTYATGWELYKYKPSYVANIELVKNISPGIQNTEFDYYEMRDVNDTLFFEITNSEGGGEIWMSKGFASNTQKVKSFAPGESIGNLFNGYNTLYFIKHDSTNGSELWKSDGTDAGTTIVKDIYPGSISSYPYWLTDCNGKIFFSAASPNKGQELWLTDGSESGTKQVKDINQTTTSSSSPYNITSYTNGVVFTAFTKEHGSELYKSDGTDAGTKLLNDITPGENSTPIYQFLSKGSKVYFTVGTSTGYSLYKTDGTTSGLKKAADINIFGFLQNFDVADNGHVFFVLFDYSTFSYELWENDGTGGENNFLATNLYYTNNLITIGNTAFFVAGDDANGYEVWKSDGTAAGTQIVKDIYPGPNGSYPSSLYNFNGKLFFTADYGLGPFLWSSDGTDAGTKLVKGVFMPYTYQNAFAQANGKLFFNGYNIVGKGYELYATDGTSSGTKLVKDINPGPASSSPYSLVSGDTLLYFLADDGKHGAELWASNGSGAGTHLVKNITPGVDPSYFNYMVNVRDNLFFTMNDTLWQSNGTKEGTGKINLTGVSGISNLAASGNTLFFSGYTYATGQELYAGTVSTGFKPATSFVQNAIASSKANNIFEARLLSNPISDQLKLAVDVKEKQTVQILIADAAGRILKSEKQILSQGSNMLSYNTETWSQGLYIIKIISADGSSLLKAIK